MKFSKDFKEKMVILGKNIQNLRREKNLTLKDLSQKTEIRTEYLKKIEEGTAYGILINKHLNKIANVFKIKIDDLFTF